MAFGFDLFTRHSRNFYHLSYDEMSLIRDALRHSSLDVETPKERESEGQETKRGTLVWSNNFLSANQVLTQGDGHFLSGEECQEIGNLLSNWSEDHVERRIFCPSSVAWTDQIELLSEREIERLNEFGNFCLEAAQEGGLQVIGSEYIRGA